MESLEQHEQIISLGKLIVNELKLEPGVDTISRWMSHYLAEKITISEQSKGSSKNASDKECFEIILKLWNHRYSWSSGKKPLQNFEPIWNTLSKLNPNREDPYFYIPDNNRNLKGSQDSDNASVKKWMDMVSAIDMAARIWIEFALNKALAAGCDDMTKEWREAASGLNSNDEIDLLDKLFDDRPLFDFEDEQDDFSKKYEVERLKKGIEELSKFTELNSILLAEYQGALKKLSE